MDNKIKIFILKVLKYYTVVVLLSIVIYSFTRHNLIFDFTAKKFVTEFSKNNLAVNKEIAEERRVVFQNVSQSKGKHFRYLIIGSSRVMQFGELIGFKNALNLAVAGANLNDMKYIYNLASRYNITYDTIIFDFNPWLVIVNSDNRYKQFNSYQQLKYAIYDILRFNYNLEDLITLFGLLNNYALSFKIASNKEIYNHTHHIKIKDGSIQLKKISPNERKKYIQSFVSRLYKMGNFYNIDTLLFKNTLDLYNSASTKGKCIITLTPFHMDLYTKKKNDIRVKNMLIIEKKLINSEGNFQVYGSFNPYDISVLEADFADGIHLKGYANYKIFNHLSASSKSN